MSPPVPPSRVPALAEWFRAAAEAARLRGDLHGERFYRHAAEEEERRAAPQTRLKLARQLRWCAAETLRSGDLHGARNYERKADDVEAQVRQLTQGDGPLQYVRAADVSDWRLVRPRGRRQRSGPGTGERPGRLAGPGGGRQDGSGGAGRVRTSGNPRSGLPRTRLSWSSPQRCRSFSAMQHAVKEVREVPAANRVL